LDLMTRPSRCLCAWT